MKNVEDSIKRQKTMSEIRQAEARAEALRLAEEKDAWDRMIAQEREQEKTINYLINFRKSDGKLINRDELNVFIFGGLDIDEQDSQGNSYVHLFVMSGDFEGVKLFCEAGASLELKNKSGKKAIDLALEKFTQFPSENSKKIIDILSGYMIDNNCNKESLNKMSYQKL